MTISRRVWVAVVGAALLIAVAAVAATSGSHAADGQSEVQAYADAIRPFQRAGGKVVAEEIKPRLADIEAGSVTPEQFRAEAVRWKQKIEEVRRGFTGVHPPDRLAAAARLYDLAMRQYQDAIDAFVAAVGHPAPELNAAITAAVPAAERADATYDRADKLVAAALTRAGVPATTLP